SLGHNGSPSNGKSRRCRLGHVISCVQSQLIACKCQLSAFLSSRAPQQCHLSLSINATCQCPSVPHIRAYQCTSMPHISAYLSCLSVPPINASQCCLSIPVSATY
ncbi:unnamed protein product, partial [Staurois parvus]